ncbi:MAG: hypothetical protein AAFU67_17850 [Bacteroidota bacterium]
MRKAYDPGPYELITDVNQHDLIVSPDSDIVICRVYKRDTLEKQMANAALLMAAPDLAEALQALLHNFKHHWNGGNLLEFEEKPEVINALAALELAGTLLSEPTIQD